MTEEPLAAPTSPQAQLEAIHSMLNAGHRGIRVERHSLVLWGVTGAILLNVTPRLMTGERFPIVWQQASVELAFLAAVLALVAVVDFRITQQVRRRQDESLPFIQRQIGKVWLLLAGLGMMATFGAHFYGGGPMMFLVWMLLVGIGLFTHGLFSEQLLGWSGGAIILLGAGALAFQIPPDGTQWLATFIFGVGLPILGFLLHPLARWAWPRRVACLFMWLGVVTIGAFVAHRINRAVDRPTASVLSLDDYRQRDGGTNEQVVSLPRGTVVPIRIALQGDLFAQPQVVSVPLELTKSLDLVLVDGKLDGRFRVEGSHWKYYRYDLTIPKQQLLAHLSRGDGFVLDYTLQLITEK